MTTEPKLLTEAELTRQLTDFDNGKLTIGDVIYGWRERGLIVPEPVDPVADVMWMIRNMDDGCEIERAIREITKRPVLTQDVLSRALISIGYAWPKFAIDRLHAALQEQLK